MNANASSWVEALRSGEYRQTSHRLRQPAKLGLRRPRFCAIGVLYDLYLRSRGESWPARACHGQLPRAALEWAEVSRELEYEVVACNDTGTSFRNIASIIEAHFHRRARNQRWSDAGKIANELIERSKSSVAADEQSSPQHEAVPAV